MKTTNTRIRAVALAALAMLSVARIACADSYSWTNLQSDIAGVAQNTDRNLVNC
jgi:hypothetical protein